jgi:hypothetical protein
MSIWKEKQSKPLPPETRMTGIFIDLETAKKLAQSINQLNKAVKKVQERSKNECKK